MFGGSVPCTCADSAGTPKVGRLAVKHCSPPTRTNCMFKKPSAMSSTISTHGSLITNCRYTWEKLNPFLLGLNQKRSSTGGPGPPGGPKSYYKEADDFANLKTRGIVTK